MAAMSDLTQDLVEDVILRVPLTSRKAVQSTCKNWNTLSKRLSFRKIHDVVKAKAATKHESLAIIIMDFKVYLMSFDLRGIHNDENVDTSIKREECNPRLVVWNPCCGQAKWIEPRNSDGRKDNYALGYEIVKSKSHRIHKILRYLDVHDMSHERNLFGQFQIYNLDSNSWEDVQDTPRWNLPFHQRGVSLKGNAYWFVQSKNLGGSCFLLCFDFTTERFGPHLGLPIHPVAEDTVSISSVRDEQLAVLFQRRGSLHMEIWITDEIDPGKVWWWSNLFLTVNINPLTSYQYPFEHGSFFVDEEKRVAVVFGRDMDEPDHDHFRYAAYITGKDGYLKKVDLGESTFKSGSPVMCSTYVPSSVQIN
ncbi:PREDICTED: F-box/kelch-repeat protein At3g16740-like [Camelina sativa]|uniref:F-box/kelch-repeat protein At3g16740-like n=1 Tax=Camelina sativa TaxID=90675 RepID=A0ABM0T1D2_CAMSA|nr:PREDICTED: F-box/kelch-repeat protein At3g16740-like [Camelina sativa]